MKYAVFHHVFKVISVNICVIPEYFLNGLGNFCYALPVNFSTHVTLGMLAVINISIYKCVIWNHFPKSSHIYKLCVATYNYVHNWLNNWVNMI